MESESGPAGYDQEDAQKHIVDGMTDLINHPPHYTASAIEPIDVIEAWKLGFHLGNTVKYVARWEHKDGLRDLKKARWYLDRFIEKAEREKQ